MAHSIRPAVTTFLIAAMSGLFGVQCDCAGGKTVVVEKTKYIPVPTYEPQAEHLADEVVFRVDPLTEDEQVADMVSVWGGELIADPSVPRGNPSAAVFLRGTYRVRLPEGMSVEDALSLLAVEQLVTFVEPNYVVEAIATPDDTWYSRLWGMPKIGAPTAWDTTTGSTDIVVGIIDTGLDVDHQDLADNVWVNSGEIPGNGVDDDENGYVDDIHGWDFCNGDATLEDVNSHGTHVGGTVAGVGNNGVGVAGVAWTAKLMGLKFLCGVRGSGSTFNATLAVRYAADNGANLTNNSWGGGGPSLALQNAIEYAADRDQLFIAAAGNDGRNIDSQGYYPCGYDLDSIISVAASTPQDVRAGFSNYGSTKVDLAAPGQGIYSATPGNAYGWKSGTSMATPMVAGAAAMLLAVNPDLTWQQVKAGLLDSVDVLGGWNGLVGTGGRLNLARAIEEVVQPPPTPDGLTVAASGASSIDCSWGEVTEENTQGYKLYARSDGGDVLPAIEVTGPETTEHRVTGLDSGEWFIAVSAFGPGGESDRSEERSVVLVDDEAPARIVDLYVAATAGPELAVESVTVDDTFGEAWVAENLLDDDPNTAWAAEPFLGGEERRVLLDLGQVQEVGQVALRPSSGFLDLFPRGFEIRVGAEQGDWTVVAKEVARQAPNGDGWRTWTFVPTDARYVEVRVDDAAIHPSGLRYVVLADVAVRAAAEDPSSLTATWTAPGDDGGSGTATEYQLRWALEMTPPTFPNATPVETDAPGEAGTKEQALLTGLTGETEIGVALRAIDDVGNVGPISNIAVANTGAYPPGRVEDLAASEEQPGVVRLEFTAPADDGDRVASGRAARYELRWSERPINGGTWPDAQPILQLPAPKDPGAAEVLIFEDLPAAAIRYFILRAVDDAGLAGPWSDEVAIDTRQGIDREPPARVTDLHAHYQAAASQALALQAEAPDDAGVEDLIDGDSRTGWLEAAAPGETVRFTLSIGAEARPLTRVRVLPHFLFPGDFPTDVQVLVTDPDSGEELVVAGKAGHRAEPGGWLQLDMPPTSTQEFHLDVTPRERFGVAVVALAEVEGYEALPGGGVAALTWIAPGDDGFAGTAQAYSIRRDGQEIASPQAFAAAEELGDAPAPRPGGDLEVFQVGGLSEGEEVWFALNAVDEVGNVGAPSNSVQIIVPSLPPAAVDDLRVVEVDKTSITLAWTAPDPRGGQLTEYDLRYVAGEMTPEAFADAQRVPTGEPGIPGAVEEIVVDGLDSDTLYSFAIVAFDGGDEDSGLSNIAEGTTLDGTPPARVLDLQGEGGPGLDAARLTWTAPGDDGMEGTAARYELRYAGDAQQLLDAFEDADLADIGGADPLAAGQAEARTVEGLTPEADYAFAMVSFDELDNRSPLSNIALVSTPAVPPAAIADLRITERTDSSFTLAWTATGDDGGVGTASAYELRHSGEPITADNFADAQIASAPAPAAAGTAESTVVVGFAEATEHFFRLVAIDDRGARSPLSNEASAWTLDITPPDRIEDLAAEPMGLSGGRVVGEISDRSGAFNEASEAAFAIDGNPASVWLSERTVAPAPAFVTVDLGEAKEVGRVRLLPASAYTHLFPADWRLEVQDPQTEEWRTAIEEQGAAPQAGEWIDREFAPLGGRYVRLSTPASRPEGARFMTALAELELFESDPGAVSAALTWTAPADDGPSGKPVEYRLRHSAQVISENNFVQAEATDAPAPGAAGLPQTWVVGALLPETTYHFAIVSIDGDGNRSLVSNDAEVTTRGLPPGTVTDLRLVEAGEDRVTLAWTAPGADGDEGQADRYDLRHSFEALNPQTWPDATEVQGEPAPRPAGAAEQFEVTGLQASTTYRFALRAFEGQDDGSALSNVVEVRTDDPPERIPPAQVGDLAVAQHAVLYEALTVSWTAAGDDDVIGTATRYDLRWSTEPIDSNGDFVRANRVVDLDAPKAAGQAESFVIDGLPRETEVFFALVVLDEEDNASPRSDDASAETKPWPPSQVVDLAAVLHGPDGARLTWTAPGGDGDEGTADHYEVYAALAPFAVHQLGAMQPLQGVPAPSVAGEAEEFVYRPVSNDTTVFFAVRAIDDKGNVGTLSPLAQVTTEDRIPPGEPEGVSLSTLNLPGTLRLSFTSPGDDDMIGRPAAYEIRWSLQEFDAGGFAAATAYNGVVSTISGGLVRSVALVGLPQESEIWLAVRAIDEEGLRGPVSEVVSARTMDSPPSRVSDLAGEATAPDRVRLTWTAPGDDANVGTATSYELRYHTTPLTLGNWADGDVAANPPAPVAAGGAQTMDVAGLASGTNWYFAVRAIDDRGNVGPVSNTILVTTPDITDPGGVNDLAAAPGPRGTLALSWTAAGDDGAEGRVHSVEVRYAPTPWPGWDDAAVSQQIVIPVLGGQAQTFTLMFLDDEVEYAVAIQNFDEGGNSGPISNVATGWTPSVVPGAVADLAATPDGLGALELTWSAPPDNDGDADSGRVVAYELAVSDAVFGTAQFEDQDLRAGPAPVDPGELQTMRIDGLANDAPYWFAVRGVDDRGEKGAVTRVLATRTSDEIAPAGVVSLVAHAPRPAGGALAVSAVDSSGELSDEWPAESAIDGDPGTAWASPPGEGAGSYVELTLATEAWVGGVRLTVGEWPDRFPVDFSIESEGSELASVGGYEAAAHTRVEVQFTPVFTDTVRVVVERSGGDDEADYAILNEIEVMPADDPPDTIRLSWVAPGDDGLEGQATSYDVRYSLAPIDAGNFEAASEVADVPDPAPAGQPQAVAVPDLAEETEYHFALIAEDEAGNRSVISNGVAASTLGIPPAPVDDLAAAADGANAVELTWTASGADGDEGQAASYEVRYRPYDLSDATWDDGAVAANPPAPAAAGSAETMRIDGLLPGTVYAFALRVTDGRGHTSLISNVPNALTDSAPDVVAPSAIGDLQARPAGGNGLPLAIADVASSGAQFPDFPSDAATDGDPDTAWASPSEDEAGEETLTLSLAALTTVDEIRLRPHDDFVDLFPSDFVVEGTANGDQWDELVSESGFEAQEGVFHVWAIDSGAYTSVRLRAQRQFRDPAHLVVVAEMAVFEAADAGTITLAFTAPGDDEQVGTADRYLLATSTAGQPIDSEAAWAAANPVEADLTPLQSGVVQALTLEGLAAGRYHFALRAEDEAGNLAPLGNSPVLDIP